MGPVQPALQPGELQRAARAPVRLPAGPRRLRAGRLRRGRPRAPARRSASSPRRPGTASSPARCSSRTRRSSRRGATCPTSRSSPPRASRRTRWRTGRGRETFIVLNFRQKLGIIGGTGYAGEIKKTVFTVLNYLLPLEGVLSMHCSANVGQGRRRRHLLRPLGHGQDDALAPTPRAAWSATTSTAGGRTASSTSRTAATRR